MKRFYLIVVALALCIGVAVAEDAEPYIKIGDYNADVIALHQKLIDLGYYYLREESPWSNASARALMILQENLDLEVDGAVRDKTEFDELLAIENVIGNNLAIGTSDEWSEWFSPEYNAENRCFTVAVAELGAKSVGDYYTCSVEIEVKDVTANDDPDQKFWFRSQGAVDGSWSVGNVWRMNFVNFRDPPEDGVYTFSCTTQINEGNVGVEKFDLGFRCDYWSAGSFRVRNVKVEKGSKATEWVAAE